MKRSLFLTIYLFLCIYTCNISISKASSEAKAISELLQAGEYLVALNILESIKTQMPCDPELLFLEARAYEAGGDTSNAISIYESLIENLCSYQKGEKIIKPLPLRSSSCPLKILLPKLRVGGDCSVKRSFVSQIL